MNRTDLFEYQACKHILFHLNIAEIAPYLRNPHNDHPLAQFWSNDRNLVRVTDRLLIWKRRIFVLRVDKIDKAVEELGSSFQMGDLRCYLHVYVPACTQQFSEPEFNEPGGPTFKKRKKKEIVRQMYEITSNQEIKGWAQCCTQKQTNL